MLLPLCVAALGGCAGSLPATQPVTRLDGTLPLILPEAADPAEHYRLGKEYLAAESYGLAVQAFQAVLSVRPADVNALNALGATYDRIGRWDLAERRYRKALEIDPNDVATLNNIGWSRLMRGVVDQAAFHFAEAERLEPDNPVVKANLEMARRQGGDPDQTPPAQDPVEPMLPADLPLAWLEKTGETEQMLVLNPDPRLKEALAKAGVVPRLASVAGVRVAADIGPAIPFVARARRAAVETESLEPVEGAAQGRAAVPVEAPVQAAALPDPSRFSLEIANGAGRDGMAARVRGWLMNAHGLSRPRIANADHFGYATTVLFHRDGRRDDAERLAGVLPVPVELAVADDLTMDLRLRLGTDFIAFDRRLSDGAVAVVEDIGHDTKTRNSNPWIQETLG